MTPLAFLMLDGPGMPHDQLRVCVFIPAVAILVSWCLIKWKPGLVFIALIVAAIAAILVTVDWLHPATRYSMLEDFGTSYTVAIVLSAGFPFLAIASFYLNAKKKANQAILQRTRFARR